MRCQRPSSEAAGPGRFAPLGIASLLFFGLFIVPSVLAQQHKPPTHDSSHPTALILAAELKPRIQALESAKRSGDALTISAASRAVLGVALRNMGVIDLMQGSIPVAIERLRRARDFEDSPDAQLDLAAAYLGARNLDESLSLATDVLVADPQNAQAWYTQGKVWMLKGRDDEAVKSFKRTLELKADPAAAYLLGCALLQVKQYEEGKAVFQKMQEASTDAAVHSLFANAYRAAGYVNDASREMRLSGKSQKARSGEHALDLAIRDAARLNSQFEPENPGAQARVQILKSQIALRTILASALNDLGTSEARKQQYSLALAHFHEAAEWDPSISGLQRNTGIAAGRALDYPECIRALRLVIAETPNDNVARTMLGTALFATQSYGDAVQVLTPLGEAVLQSPELAYSLASSLVLTNKYPLAGELLNKMEQQSLSTETLMLVVQLWSQMANYEHTIEVCHRALQLDSKLPRAHYMAGLALLRLNRSEEAAQEFQSELLLDPDNTDAEYHLGFSLLQQAQTDQAVTLWRKVLASRPEHPEANYELGKELLIEGSAAEAVKYLEAAVRLKPQFEPAHYQLQSAYRAVGRKQDADREAAVYRAMKAKSRNITLPPPRTLNAGPPATK